MKKLSFLIAIITLVASVQALNYRFPIGNLDIYGNSILNASAVTGTTFTATNLNVLSAPASCANYSNYFYTFWNGSVATCTPVNNTAILGPGNQYQIATWNSSGGLQNVTGLSTDVSNRLLVGRDIVFQRSTLVGDVALYFLNTSGKSIYYVNSTDRLRIDFKTSAGTDGELAFGNLYFSGADNGNFSFYSDAVNRTFGLLNPGAQGLWLKVDDKLSVNATPSVSSQVIEAVGNANVTAVILNPQASPPNPPVHGMLYVDTTKGLEGTLCMYNGTAWNNVMNRTQNGNCA